ncbi:MAG: sugar ABC transporter ATP-binding protein [Micrococcales bacterium]|nr:sugar ABC transporter ATP-binding protein [Micrococcales bacterium]
MNQTEQAAPAVEVRGATKTYGPIVALDDVSFTLRPGGAHALLGHNGAGKSTLVNVLSGVVTPDRGEVLLDGKVVELRSPRQAQAAGIAVVAQELSVVPTLTVHENILLGKVGAGVSGSGSIDRDQVRALLARLGLAGVSPETMVEDLSMGERQLIEIARALSRNARVLILDEPTASLADREIQRVFGAVREVIAEGRSVVFVTHRLGEVLDLCTRVTVMRDGAVTITRDVAGLDRDSIVQLMLGDVAARTEVARADAAGREGLVDIEGLTVPGHVDNFSLQAKRGQIVGIAGQVGSGASEVVRALAGLVPDARGQVRVGRKPLRPGAPGRSLKAGVVFASNDRKSEGLFLDQSIARNLVATRLRAASKGGILSSKRIKATSQRLIDLISIERSRLPQPAATLSGGNQQKVFLGRCLDREDAELMLFDEPTRGVDVGGRVEIHNLIRHAASAGNAVVFVSTDHEEVLDLADTVVTMFAGRVTRVARSADMTSAMLLGDMTHGSADQAGQGAEVGQTT